jgi:succinate dehydrogenase/fumarate reductase flavoprotein subunit
MEKLDCDLIVLGAGMAGLSAAALAAERGAVVMVVEKADQIGGSAAISGGYVWTVPALGALRAIDPGDMRLAGVVVSGFADAVEWLRRLDVVVTGPLPIFYGRGYQIDMQRFLQLCTASVTSAGGSIVMGTRSENLVTEGGSVVGVLTSHRDGMVELRAPHTILATGGLQGSPAHRAANIHPNAHKMTLRANPNSVGDGLELAIGAGGCQSTINPGFYGHLLCYPVDATPNRFVEFSQMHGEQSILVGLDGKRFVDESIAYHLNAQATLRQQGAAALLVWDDVVQRAMTQASYISNKAPLDKFAIARDAGANCTIAANADELSAFADGAGFDGACLVMTLREYNEAAVAAPETLVPPRMYGLRPFDTPPFYALEVRPAITMSQAGIRTDEMARATTVFGEPIPGLLVAGGDVGDVYRGGYAGGLSMALTFARRAVTTAGWLN